MSLADDNHNPAAVTRLVAYLYQDDYDDLEELPPFMDIRAINSARREELAIRVKEELPEWMDSRYSLSSMEGLIDPKTANTRCSLPDSARRMKANLSVFAFAEFLNIKDLEDQAQETFLGRARYWFPTPRDEVPAMIKAIGGATSARDEGIRGPILRKLAEDYCENQGLLAHERCVQALKEHGDFAVGLVEAVRKHLQWHFTTSENENIALKQKISGFEEKDGRREWEVKLMTRNLQDAHKQLSQMVESRLRDSQKGGTTIGDVEK